MLFFCFHVKRLICEREADLVNENSKYRERKFQPVHSMQQLCICVCRRRDCNFFLNHSYALLKIRCLMFMSTYIVFYMIKTKWVSPTSKKKVCFLSYTLVTDEYNMICKLEG